MCLGWPTSCSVQPTTATVAFEMLCLLMRDQELQVFEITFALEWSVGVRLESDVQLGEHKLTVVTPWALKELLDVGV